MGISLAVFDLDGTLNRTDLFSVPAVQDIQKALGFPVTSAEHIISSYGAAYQEFMEINFPGGDEQTALAYQRMIAEREAWYMHLAKPYEGVPELLDRLHQMGFQTAVCSNSSLRYITSALKGIGISAQIDYVQPLENGMENKSQSLAALLQKCSPSKAVMVGDTLYDCKAARDNRIPFIGCLYGFRPYEMKDVELTAERPLNILPIIQSIFALE